MISFIFITVIPVALHVKCMYFTDRNGGQGDGEGEDNGGHVILEEEGDGKDKNRLENRESEKS